MSKEEQIECPICAESARKMPRGGYLRIECPRCGDFHASEEFLDDVSKSPGRYFDGEGSRKRANLSAWLRQKADQRAERRGPELFLDTSFLDPDQPNDLRDAFEAAGNPRFHEKADKLLLAIEKETKYAGQEIQIPYRSSDILAWHARSWALNKDEFYEICRYLEYEGRIKEPDEAGVQLFSIAPIGWGRIEELASTKQASTQGFVAMWFDKEMKPFYEKAFKPAIYAAGYLPRRIDHDPPTERLADEIEAEIKRSKFVLADLTGHRNGVYFEAGFARGFGIPVIWTCRSDDFEKLHFDVQQFHCIEWKEDELEELIDKLRWRIENICGRGPEKCKEAN